MKIKDFNIGNSEKIDRKNQIFLFQKINPASKKINTTFPKKNIFLKNLEKIHTKNQQVSPI